MSDLHLLSRYHVLTIPPGPSVFITRKTPLALKGSSESKYRQGLAQRKTTYISENLAQAHMCIELFLTKTNVSI